MNATSASKLIIRGLLGAIGVSFFYITIIELGAARVVVTNLISPIITAGLIFLAPNTIHPGIGPYDLLAISGSIITAGLTLIATMMINRRPSKSLSKPLTTKTSKP